MKTIINLLLLAFFFGCGETSVDSASVDAARKRVIVYDTIRKTIIINKDSIVYKPVLKQVAVNIYIPKDLQDKIKSGTIKYTVTIK